jgi:signal transduction histidine kinase
VAHHLTREGVSLEKEVRGFFVTVDGEACLAAFVCSRGPHLPPEAEVRQLTRLYEVLLEVSQTIARVKDRQALFQAICEVATRPGRYRMAWVGVVEAGLRVTPVASAGHVADYLEGVRITVSGADTSKGPTGLAVRTGQLQVCSDMARDLRMSPWRMRALSRGYLASAAVPFRQGGQVIGALNLYAPEPDFFSARECELLAQVGVDLSAALESLESAAQQELLKDRLARSQRLESIGRLAGGIGHDFNNLLTVILSSVDEASALAGGPRELQDKLASIRDAAERSARLTRQLLAVGRQQPSQVVELSLSEGLERDRPLLERLVGPGVSLLLDVAPTPRIKLDPAHLDQILTNLAANARDAMDGRGELRISTDTLESEGATWAVLAVADNGPGIPEVLRSRLFEPFITTKAPDRGTGLGLATVYGLVSQALGRIEVATGPGKGTRFTVLLPAA